MATPVADRSVRGVPSHPEPGVAELVARRGGDAQERVAFVEGASGRELRGGDLEQATRGWAPVVAGIGGGGSAAPVGLLVGDPLGFIACFVAALALGVTVAPLDPDASPAELDRQARVLGLVAVVTDRPAGEVVAAIPGSVGVWEVVAGGALRRGRPPSPPTSRAPAAGRPAAAVVMMSSGTTGEPKIVPLGERQLLPAPVVSHQRPGGRRVVDPRVGCPPRGRPALLGPVVLGDGGRSGGDVAQPGAWDHRRAGDVPAACTAGRVVTQAIYQGGDHGWPTGNATTSAVQQPMWTWLRSLPATS